jgi:hypothetical protein
MSLDKIQQLVGSLTKSVEDSERIPTPILAARLAKAVIAHPSDQTLGAMSRVISKMAANNTLFIRRADLKQLYTKLFSRNTKFAELFQDELGQVPTLQGAKTMERDEAVQVSPYQVGDQILANALQSVFDKHLPVKMYSQPLADHAKVSVATTLDAWNLRPTKLEISDGNDKFLVIRADYETPKGIASIYVPVEIDKNQITEASVFMGNGGPQELNHTSLKSYLTTHAGTKLAIDGTTILEVLTNATAEGREVSDAEIALTKLNATRQGKSEFFVNQVVGQKISEASKKDVELPKYNEFESFEKKFASARGQAEFSFGAEVIKVAGDHLTRELLGYGHKNPQVAVSKTEENTVFYSVALDGGRVGFTVPVKVSNGKIVKPTFMLCNGSVSSFSQEGINQLYVNNHSDYKAAAVASPLHELTSADLLNNIRKSLAEGNLVAAEDALNVLSNGDNKQAYASGFQLFMNGLNIEKTASAPQATCSLMISSSSSQHAICAHTGLPLHRVYQDKDGNCRPLYRQGMNENYEGAIFNNSKIFG